MEADIKMNSAIYTIRVTNKLTSEEGEIRRFQSERFVFTVETENIRYKIFQVIFGKSDGSIYVSFPYFDITQGIASTGTISDFLESEDIDLKTNGKVTSKRVKYAHHPDGEVHFSQTGKVSTSIRRKSIPLLSAEGHLFSINIQGLEHFERAITGEYQTPKISRTVLSFKFDKKITGAVKFVARWQKPSTLLNQSTTKKIKSTIVLETPDGKRSMGFLVGPPENWPMDKKILVINCEEIPLIDKENDAALIFIGGFNPRKINEDIKKASSFLCISYPVLDYDDLKKQIGSIDLE